VAGARRPDGDQIPTTDGKKEVKVSKFWHVKWRCAPQSVCLYNSLV
jgi:hypothetical protein